MRKLFLVVLTFLSLLNWSCQNDRSLKRSIALYEQAMNLSDAGTASVALNQIILESQEQRILNRYVDSLARLYYRMEQFRSAYALLDSFGCYHNDLVLIKGLSALGTGDQAAALNILEPWVYADTTGNILSRYVVATLLLNEKGHKIALNLLDEIVQQEASLTETVQVASIDGSVEVVSAYAASHALAARAYMELGQYANASRHVVEALDKQPDFLLAQRYLLELQPLLDVD